MVSRDDVLRALSEVRDPELDEPITELGFVAGVENSGDAVEVSLRLPTYFCAPNFAYMMVADAREAVLGLPGVRQARVGLSGHFCGDEIGAGAASGGQSFAGNGGQDLDELRQWFRSKAFLARQAGLCRELLQCGYSQDELGHSRLGDIPDSRAKAQYLRRRAELGLRVEDTAALLVDTAGKPIPEDAVGKHLRLATATQLNTEGNAAMCRAVLASRYGSVQGAGQKEEP